MRILHSSAALRCPLLVRLCGHHTLARVSRGQELSGTRLPRLPWEWAENGLTAKLFTPWGMTLGYATYRAICNFNRMLSRGPADAYCTSLGCK